MQIPGSTPPANSEDKPKLTQEECYLPDEVMLRIFENLSPQELLQARLTNRRFNTITGDQGLRQTHIAKVVQERLRAVLRLKTQRLQKICLFIRK